MEGTSKKEGLGERRACDNGEHEVDVARPRGRHMEGPWTLDSRGGEWRRTGINRSGEGWITRGTLKPCWADRHYQGPPGTDRHTDRAHSEFCAVIEPLKGLQHCGTTELDHGSPQCQGGVRKWTFLGSATTRSSKLVELSLCGPGVVLGKR